MTPADLDLASALRQLLRHPLVRDELRAILAEAAPAAGGVEEGFISTREAARRASVRPAAIVAWIDRGILPASKPPGTRGWRIKPGDLAAVLAGQLAGPPPVFDLEKQRKVRADALAAAAKLERDR